MPIRYLPLVLLLVTFSIAAADSGGHFSVKGAGLGTCQEFIAARSDAGRYGIYQGWLDGYLSGFNRFSEQTYDLTPWAGNHLLMALIEQHCRAHPRKRFHTAVETMLAGFQGERLKKKSRAVRTPGEGNSQQWTYVEIVRRVQQRLQELDLYQGAVDGAFSEQTREAVQRYQEKHRLKGDGRLNQSTLYLLFKDGLGTPGT